MFRLLALVACLVGAHCTIIDIFDTGNGHEARVAINCGKVPFYVDRETGAWIADPEGTTLCDDYKETVKSFCKKIYPKLNVTNIVEANKDVQFNNWCDEGSVNCHQKEVVTPYRCLVHEYEADALMVPNGCTFDHLHDSNKCMSNAAWKDEARDKCHEDKMYLRESGILLSCGTDVFTGVEYVCCPPKHKKEVVVVKPKRKKLERKLKMLAKKESKGKITQKKFQKKEKKITHKIAKKMKKIQKKKEKKQKKAAKRDRHALRNAITGFQKFMPGLTDGCDRAQFVVKETSREDRHRSRIAAVVEEWDEAEKRYNKLKALDPTAAEEKMKRTLEVFRETLAALEEEAKEEKARLRVEHANCINIDISKQKRDAMIDYIGSVEEEPVNSDRILRSVRRFIQVCEHDRVHSLRHFEHVRNRDPEKAKLLRTVLLTHLKDLNTAVNSSMSLLNFLPKIANEFGLGDNMGVMLRPRLAMPDIEPIVDHGDQVELPDVLKPDYEEPEDYEDVGTRQPIDELPEFESDKTPLTEEVMTETMPNNPMTEEIPVEEKPKLLGRPDEVPEEYLPAKKLLGSPDEVPAEYLPQNLLGHKDEMPKEFLPKIVLGHQGEVPKEYLPKPQTEEHKTQHAKPHKKVQEKVKEPQHLLKELKNKRSAGFAAVIGLSCGALVIMLGILVALVVRRRRTAAHHHVVIPTEENDDQEHLVQMQKKGFENPTYKFYYY